MIFNSLPFLIFLPIVLAIYFVLEKKAQNIWLLLASWFFYAWWDVRFLSLVLISTVIDYAIGRKLENAEEPHRRRIFLCISLFTNLGILGFFKYYGFFADSLIALLEPLHLAPSVPILQVVLPLGISFYTFQTMAYTIDVYRKRQPAERDPIVFALYVCYFPQLVAGPIERAQSLIPQLTKVRRVTWDMVTSGLLLILFGFFKKVAVADILAHWVDPVFVQPDTYSGLDRILATYGFALQIYCDFSGYTDIARGCSLLLGIHLMKNFEHPYFSTSITDFWRRWHISLSAWLKDYLYISLGGNRQGALRTYRNLMLTMLLGGLWHGASWNFVIWGGLHGVYLAGHKMMGGHATSSNTAIIVLKSLATFHLVCFSWIFFRSPDLPHTLTFIAGLPSQLTQLSLPIYDLLRCIFPLLGLLCLEVMQFRDKDHLSIRKKPMVFQVAFYTYLFLCLIIFGAIDEKVSFIYFQF